MNTIHTNAPEVRNLAAQAFPGYNGKTFSVSAFNGPRSLPSCWDSGSRSYYVLVNMATGKTWTVPENGNPFSNGGKTFRIGRLPHNVALVEHHIAFGKDMGIAICVHPENLNRYALPAPQELTRGQKIVLSYTRSRKSSHNGRNRQQMAFEDCGFPAADWEKSKAECIAVGWLNKAGAITDAGRNVIGWLDPWTLRQESRQEIAA